MRLHLFICVLFLIQLSIGAGEKGVFAPINDFIAKYETQIKEGKQIIKITGPYVKGFVNLGRFVKCVVNLCLDDVEGEKQRREILTDITDVTEKIETMGRKIDDNFNSLKSFYVEHDFYTKFIVTAETQFEFLRGVLKYRKQESIDLFNKHYSENHPILNIVEVSKRLTHHDITNPIVSAMKADPLRSKQTFRKWTTAFFDLFTTMHISFLFHEGLNGRNVTESEQVFGKLTEASNKINSFITHYKNDYWPHAVQSVMRDVRDYKKELSNIAKANFLKQRLQNIETMDSFIILVFDQASDQEQAYRAADANNVILSKPDGMLIYRSRLARNMTADQKWDFIEDVKWMIKRDCYENSDGLGDSVEELFLGIADAGFIGLIKDDKNVAVRKVGDDYGRKWYFMNNCFKLSKHSGTILPIQIFAAPH